MGIFTTLETREEKHRKWFVDQKGGTMTRGRGLVGGITSGRLMLQQAKAQQTVSQPVGAVSKRPWKTPKTIERERRKVQQPKLG